MPSDCSSSWARSLASAMSSPCSTTRAPSASVPWTLTLGVNLGITIVAGMPSLVAW